MDRAEALLNMIAASSPNGIEEQEKNGQSRFAANSTLPRKMNNAQPLLEQLGFVFGDVADELFVNVQMPEGWSKRAQEGTSYWTDLLDERGRVRGAIFYKAAFYDKDAFFRLHQRYSAESYIPCDADGTPIKGDLNKTPDYFLHAIRDWDRSIVHAVGHRRHKDFGTADTLEELAAKWLEENKPDWNNPMAYWNPEATPDA
jgi:hypothetical protein